MWLNGVNIYLVIVSYTALPTQRDTAVPNRAEMKFLCMTVEYSRRLHNE